MQVVALVPGAVWYATGRFNRAILSSPLTKSPLGGEVMSIYGLAPPQAGNQRSAFARGPQRIFITAQPGKGDATAAVDIYLCIIKRHRGSAPAARGQPQRKSNGPYPKLLTFGLACSTPRRRPLEYALAHVLRLLPAPITYR